MRLQAFREAVLAEAREDAQRRLDETEQAARRRLESAQAQAAELVEDARQEGRDSAERETGRHQMESRRTAREQVLQAHHDAVVLLRRRVLTLLRERRHSKPYRDLLVCLEERARQQLGTEAEVDNDPDGGGFVARADGRRVDYRLPTLVERVMDEMGTELEDLWR